MHSSHIDWVIDIMKSNTVLGSSLQAVLGAYHLIRSGGMSEFLPMNCNLTMKGGIMASPECVQMIGPTIMILRLSSFIVACIPRHDSKTRKTFAD